MSDRPLPSVVAALGQDRVWIHREPLEDMDRHHRANLIPYLRRNAVHLHAATFDVDPDPDSRPEAEEWLAQTPLMQRLVELEAGRPLEQRHETALRNRAHEELTGYVKIDLGAVPRLLKLGRCVASSAPRAMVKDLAQHEGLHPRLGDCFSWTWDARASGDAYQRQLEERLRHQLETADPRPLILGDPMVIEVEPGEDDDA